jgi:hypothetical protein
MTNLKWKMTNDKCHGSGGTRTHNPRLKRPLPYRLGHRPVTTKLLAEAVRTAQISVFTCFLEFRERENRSRKVIDAD